MLAAEKYLHNNVLKEKLKLWIGLHLQNTFRHSRLVFVENPYECRQHPRLHHYITACLSAASLCVECQFEASRETPMFEHSYLYGILDRGFKLVSADVSIIPNYDTDFSFSGFDA